ncbi:S-adenosyl-L-methionine-dependent methyltransferase [Halteromyces radiatus]|uniref:S-adenosyl-L-methionine-dependent methyltransferase n=1 Tax=Halteromyces radiatus TaxID=101107 RepID=UPI00221FD59D|nr:S-adenosyl-L-methionine-dependent methyltransferase [Halteromyces radiatus]KAI8086282.1 S-adenosyl-L-methionine-dependent methyltransferase [Halteromyces radiatus]
MLSRTKHSLQSRLYGITTKRLLTTQGFSTIDAAEVKKFSDISEQWWDPNGEFGMLQLLNPPRVAYVRDRLTTTKTAKPFEGLRMLDIGCGGGLLSESLVRLGGNVVGADASSDNIKMAKLHARKDPQLWRGPGKLDYRHTTAEDLLAAKEQFDVVLAMEIIEHVNQPLAFLQTCGQLTRPGGSLFLSTMSRTPIAYGLTVFLAEKVLGVVHDGTHDWSKYIKSQELKDAILSFGQEWQVDDIRGIAWDPICRRWVMSQRNGDVGIGGFESLEVNYIMTARRRHQDDDDLIV